MNLREYEIMFGVEDRYWWYRGMRQIAERVLGDVLRSLVPTGRPLRLLDAGCGTGANLAHMTALRPGVEGVGLDLEPAALGFCRHRGLGRLVNGSAAALPFAAGSFDVVTSRDVLVCLEDDEAALREYARVLAPGGFLFVTVAAFESLRGEHDRAVHGLRRYRRAELVGKLGRAGFEVVRASYANAFLSPAIWLHRRARSLLAAADSDARAVSDFAFDPSSKPGLANALLTGLLGLEARLLSRFDLPVGVTLLALGRRRPRALADPLAGREGS